MAKDCRSAPKRDVVKRLVFKSDKEQVVLSCGHTVWITAHAQKGKCHLCALNEE